VHSVAKYIVHVASLKTIYEKLQENSYMGKKSTTNVFRTIYNLQDCENQDLLDPLSHPIFTRKTEYISYVRQDHLHTHDRQNESNTIAVIKRTRV
jgi:hypothetical protein